MITKIFPATILAALLVGCASAPERPTAEMTRARTLIEQAEQQGAQEFAAGDLERAREKLRRAEADAEKGRTAEAQRLAMQAALDAEFATVKASSEKAEKAADELDRSIETLRQESSRKPAS